MRRRLVCIFALLALLGVGAKNKDKEPPPLREATGLEWLQMSVGERNAQILASMMRLTKAGVAFTDPLDEYYRAVYDAVRRDASLYETPVTQIVARHARRREPKARPALDAFERLGAG